MLAMACSPHLISAFVRRFLCMGLGSVGAASTGYEGLAWPLRAVDFEALLFMLH